MNKEFDNELSRTCASGRSRTGNGGQENSDGASRGAAGKRPDKGSLQKGAAGTKAARDAAGQRPQSGGGRRPPDNSGYETRRKTVEEVPLQIGSNGSYLSGSGSRKAQDSNRAAADRLAEQAAKRKRVRRAVIMALAEVVTLICIGLYGYALRINNSVIRPNSFDRDKIKNPDLTPAQTEHMKGYWTIAVFGVDDREGNVHSGSQSDVIMLCNIDRDTGEVKLVSVYRDTYMNTNEKNTYNKINSAFAMGGAEQALAALNRNLDLNIEDYVTFNWKSVADGINMLGGVDDIDITRAEFRYINGFITETVKSTGVPSVQLKSAGVHHLDGVQAVAYARLRKMDTDFVRTERQRRIIKKTFEKAKKADLGLLNRILMMEVEQIETSLSFSDFTDLILDIGKYHIGETEGFPLTLDDVKMGAKGDCVIPKTLETNVAELHKFLFNEEDYSPTSLVKKISARITADTGAHKQAGHKDTGGDSKKAGTKKAAKETDETKSETPSKGGSAMETDADGNPIKPTKEGGSAADGTRPEKPEENTPGGTGPTKPGESTSDGGEPGGNAGPAKQGDTTSDGSGPWEQGDSAKPYNPSAPWETGSSQSDDSNTGPGVQPSSPDEPAAIPESSAGGPGRLEPGGPAGPEGKPAVQPKIQGSGGTIPPSPVNAA